MDIYVAINGNIYVIVYIYGNIYIVVSFLWNKFSGCLINSLTLNLSIRSVTEGI